MNILITGCNGFLGTELSNYLKNKNNIFATNRNNLDPRNLDDVKSYFEQNKIDVVVHTAIKGGKLGHKEDTETFFDNIKMFENLYLQKDKFKLMINFGSGAEFDRQFDINIANEKDIYNFTPKDYYGLSKNLITRKILESNSNIINLRLFGCFGKNEEEQRLFKNSIKRIKENVCPIINQDKYMDYFFIKDVNKVVEYIINNYETLNYKDYNLVYENKYKLSNLVQRILDQNKSELKIEILKKDAGLNYTGNHERLKELKLDLIGLDDGINSLLQD